MAALARQHLIVGLYLANIGETGCSSATLDTYFRHLQGLATITADSDTLLLGSYRQVTIGRNHCVGLTFLLSRH